MLCLVVDGVATICIVGIQVVICIGIIIGRRFVCLIDMLVSAEVEGVYYTCDRHVFLLQGVGKNSLQTVKHTCGICLSVHINLFLHVLTLPLKLHFLIVLLSFLAVNLSLNSKLARLYLLVGHAHIAVEPEAIAMGKEEVEIVVAVPVALQHGGYLVLCKLVVERLRVSHILVICDTTVLRHLLVVDGEH